MQQSHRSPFLLRIVDQDEAVVTLRAGGALEANLTELFVRHILALGVGFGRTEAHVEADIRQGIKDAIMSLKAQTIHAV